MCDGSTYNNYKGTLDLISYSFVADCIVCNEWIDSTYNNYKGNIFRWIDVLCMTINPRLFFNPEKD